MPTCAVKSGLHKESWRKKRIFRWCIRPIEDAVNYYNATEAEKSARDELQRTVAEYRSKDPKTAV